MCARICDGWWRTVESSSLKSKFQVKISIHSLRTKKRYPSFMSGYWEIASSHVLTCRCSIFDICVTYSIVVCLAKENNNQRTIEKCSGAYAWGNFLSQQQTLYILICILWNFIKRCKSAWKSALLPQQCVCVCDYLHAIDEFAILCSLLFHRKSFVSVDYRQNVCM